MKDSPAIWVDADACPNPIKEILFRAAERTQTMTTLVANHHVSVPRSSFIKSMQVNQGFDVADNEIAKRVRQGDLVVTSDIPLANDVIELGALAISPRGELFTKDNIKPRLNLRDFMETMRSSGIQSGGPDKLSDRDKKSFAGHLEKWLTNTEKTNL